MKNKTSIFHSIYNDLVSIKDPSALFEKMVGVVNESKIDKISKKKILIDISPIKDDLHALYRYLTNSFLKFEGNGVVGMMKR